MVDLNTDLNIGINTSWDCWYHSIEDKSWTNNSYKLIYSVTNLYDLKFIKDNLEQNHLQNGMFFVMRKEIFPTWEDPDNREGCCISFKVPAPTLLDQWNFILERVLTEDIFTDKLKYEEINGISISPKKEFNIIKLWLRNNIENYTEFIKEYPPFFIKDKSVYKKHFN